MTQKIVLDYPEKLRRVVSRDGHEQRLTGVTSMDITGSWARLECDQGYVIINHDNVLMYIVKTEGITV